VLSTHRRNYKGFDQGDIERNFARLRELLGVVACRHPEAIYLCGDEVAQLTRRAYSIVHRGSMIICRNYGADRVKLTIDIAGQEQDLTLPRGELTITLGAG